MGFLQTVATAAATVYFMKQIVSKNENVTVQQVAEEQSISLEQLESVLKEKFYQIKSQLEKEVGERISDEKYINILREFGVDVEKILQR